MRAQSRLSATSQVWILTASPLYGMMIVAMGGPSGRKEAIQHGPNQNERHQNRCRWQ